MSATCKALLIAAVFGAIGLSVQTAAQARDLGVGTRSFSHGMRSFAVDTRAGTRTKFFDGRFLRTDDLRPDTAVKPSSAFMVKVETTTTAKKRVHGYVPLQVKGASATRARGMGKLATPKHSPQDSALLVPAVQSARPAYTPPPPPTCATPGNCWPHHQPQN